MSFHERKKISRTQRETLAALARKLYRSMRNMPAAESSALGGLTEPERRQLAGVYLGGGEWIDGERVLGLRTDTWRVLERHGLIERTVERGRGIGKARVLVNITCKGLLVAERRAG